MLSDTVSQPHRERARATGRPGDWPSHPRGQRSLTGTFGRIKIEVPGALFEVHALAALCQARRRASSSVTFGPLLILSDLVVYKLDPDRTNVLILAFAASLFPIY
jgi:hypothetical protein